jgi:hypothetical protein
MTRQLALCFTIVAAFQPGARSAPSEDVPVPGSPALAQALDIDPVPDAHASSS